MGTEHEESRSFDLRRTIFMAKEHSTGPRQECAVIPSFGLFLSMIEFHSLCERPPEADAQNLLSGKENSAQVCSSSLVLCLRRRLDPRCALEF